MIVIGKKNDLTEPPRAMEVPLNPWMYDIENILQEVGFDACIIYYNRDVDEFEGGSECKKS